MLYALKKTYLFVDCVIAFAIVAVPLSLLGVAVALVFDWILADWQSDRPDLDAAAAALL